MLERSLEEAGAVENDIEPVYYSSLLEGDRNQFLEDVRRLSTSLDADLDYGPEVELVEAHRMGDSLLVRDGETPVGLAICHTRPHADEGETNLLRIQTLCVDETHPYPALGSMLGVVGILASEVRASKIRLPLPSRCWEGLRLLSEQGYRVSGSRLRMSLLGYPERGDASRMNLALWS